MKRNHFLTALLALFCVFIHAGCSTSSADGKQPPANTVAETMNEQMDATDGKDTGSKSTSSASNKAQSKEKTYDKVDYDLTQMNSDMVYSTIYNMLNTPEDYLGKIVKVKGTMATFHDEQTDQYYYSCVIADAMACCSQGLEFIWGDGTHEPSEYPEDGADLVVTGVFETYEENNVMYYRLNHATITMVQFNIQ